jgi:DNA-directed RNA polymerase specialized sigma24 family protein
MATDLRERLSDLAAHEPHSAPPADLWRRGVRRRRLTQAGSAAAVAVLVLLLGAGGLAWQADRSRVEPAARPCTQLSGVVGRGHAGSRLAPQEALRLLAPRQRAVIVLRYYEDLTEVQTAAALGIAAGTVKSQTRYALKRLREAMPELADVLVSP